MRKNLLLSEVLTAVHNSPEAEKKAVLKSYETPGLLTILRYAYCPQIEFDCGIPEYNPSIRPAGTDLAGLQTESRRLYIFTKDYQKVTPQRKRELLLQILESVNVTESKLLCQVLQKNVKVKGLTPELIEETFPGLLAHKEGNSWKQYKSLAGSSTEKQDQKENESLSSKVGQNISTPPNPETNDTKSETRQKSRSRSKRVIS